MGLTPASFLSVPSHPLSPPGVFSWLSNSCGDLGALVETVSLCSPCCPRTFSLYTRLTLNLERSPCLYLPSASQLKTCTATAQRCYPRYLNALLPLETLFLSGNPPRCLFTSPIISVFMPPPPINSPVTQLSAKSHPKYLCPCSLEHVVVVTHVGLTVTPTWHAVT